jgi:signal transduction histidine kinase
VSHQALQPSPTALAARVAQAFDRGQRLAYAVLSPDLEVVRSSDKLGDLASVPGIPLQGRRLPAVFDEFVGADQALADVLRGKAASYSLGRVNRVAEDGEIGYLNFEVLPFDPGQPSLGLLLLVEDVTHTGRLEQDLVQDRNDLRLAQAQLARANAELQRLNRLKSLFLSIAAHDLRAPLSAILGYTELLRRLLPGESVEEVGEFLDIISSQVDWLNRLITDFLDLDQIEDGKLALNLRPCDLVSLVQNIARVMEGAARRAGHEMVLELPQAPLVLSADAERLQQILFNLLSNAVKYTPAGGSVRVVARRQGDQAQLIVQDNGRGMTAEELDRLFQLYYRTRSVQAAGVAGTGLGLYIVKTLVEAHHGDVEVESEPGKGSKFLVSLPISQPATTGK